MELDPGMGGEELGHPRGLVGCEVITNDVDRPRRLGGHEGGEEGHKRLAGVAGRRVAKDVARARVERGIERQRAMPDVLEPVALGAAGGQGQDRVEAVERLDRRLLIDAKDRGAVGWMRVSKKVNMGWHSRRVPPNAWRRFVS